MMEKGSVVGLTVTLVGVFASATLHGINATYLFSEVAALLIVWCGSIGAAITAFPFPATRNLPRCLKKVLQSDETYSASAIIDQVVALTSRARTDGMLALDEASTTIVDPFLRKGIQLAVDGTDSETLKQTLHTEIAAMRERHKVGQAWCTQAGVFAPTFGIIGAVFGLMATMAQLTHPEKVGAGIAAAFVATFWGVFLANGVWLPFANKLKQLSAREVAHKRLIAEGVMAIHAGVSPRVIEDLLNAHVPPTERTQHRGPQPTTIIARTAAA
jgi:chemotaxis protein MotA